MQYHTVSHDQRHNATAMQESGNLTALIIEPHTGMRSSIHNMLNQCGVTRIEHAISSGTAIRPLQKKAFDLVLCEYDLGDGQDGQQLLEDLRHNKLLPAWTIFIIVTAERTYQKVVSAAELSPTDYILKPFTADRLADRIARAIRKRDAFMPVYRLLEQGHLPAAIVACIHGEANEPRYAADFLRLRAELHVELGEAATAEKIYTQLTTEKSLAWARLGMARAMILQDRLGGAEHVLSSLVDDNPDFIEAYDWLARTYEAMGKLPRAKEVLEQAVQRSPHAVRRLRKLGDVATDIGDTETAERVYQLVVAKARYSEYRDPEDHVRLIKTLLAKGDTTQAAALIRDLEKSVAGSSKTPACRAIAAVLVYTQAGKSEHAIEALGKAVTACRENTGLSSELKMTVARSCLDYDLEKDAAEVMCDVMSNAADAATSARAVRLFEQAGRADLAESVARESRRRVVELVAAGADRARQGDHTGAVALMDEAAQRLPDNPQVIFNAAVATLKCLEHNGWDVRLGDQARRYIQSARRLDPANPRLTSLAGLYTEIYEKHSGKVA